MENRIAEKSELSVKGTLSASVDAADHVSEVAHAQVETTGLTEETIVKFLLVLLGVLGGIADALTIFFFGVASPHAVNGLFACKEVSRTLLEHCGVAHIHSDLIVLALSVSVS